MNEWRRYLWALIGAILIMYVALGALAVYVYFEASQAHSALCTFRDDLEARADNTDAYLDKHHEKILLGVPRATFVQSLANQRKTLASLNDLSC